MASFVKMSTSVIVTEGGVTTVDREFIKEFEITGKIEGSYWLDPTVPSVTLCVRGTDLATGGPGGVPITDPMVLGLSNIRGFVIENDINVEARLNSAADVQAVAQGHFGNADGEVSIIEITRDDTRSGEIRYIMWGDR